MSSKQLFKLLIRFLCKQYTFNLKLNLLGTYLLGRKVRILKVDAQSCLYNMLKSDILASFWRIAFENPFNGD